MRQQSRGTRTGLYMPPKVSQAHLRPKKVPQYKIVNVETALILIGLLHQPMKRKMSVFSVRVGTVHRLKCM